MHGIAEGIENRRDFAVDSGIVPPDVAHGQRNVFGECSGAIHADALRMRAKMPAPGQAVAATPADHVAFAADDFAWMKVVDIRADFDNFADELVPDGHGNGNGGSRPIVPFINMQIGAADAGVGDAN